ncbi:hypothetical protein BC936DRAFT_138290 [Jimgerdemannia flammicorona]|uniref:Uncharacterized protein n=1 Tax=Jimgerdemannia flammicorona TaxID=994334 RepID=A0A433CTM7_9FUNG|nr:hypothetical protein BC936DRAFT_138290 [Jimgerdemannia flammicorona]
MRPIGSTTSTTSRVNQQFTKFAHANSLPMHRVHRMVEGKGVCVQSLIADSSASSATVSEPSIKERGDLEDAFATPLRRESKITHEPLVTPNKRTKQREEVVPGCSGEHHLPGKAELRVADSVPDHVVGRSSNWLAIMNLIEGDSENKFRTYCEKILMDFYNLVDIRPTLSKTIKERKYIVQNIAPLFRFYELTFDTMTFDWIESHTHRLRKSRRIRTLDDKDFWQVEVAGPPSLPSPKYATDETKKSLHTDLLNLVAILMEYLDYSVEVASQIKVLGSQIIGDRMTLYSLNMQMDGSFLASELYSAIFPFPFDARNRFKAVLRMMTVFHCRCTTRQLLQLVDFFYGFQDEVTEQVSLMKKLDIMADDYQGQSVRDVLAIPKSLHDVLRGLLVGCGVWRLASRSTSLAAPVLDRSERLGLKHNVEGGLDDIISTPTPISSLQGKCIVHQVAGDEHHSLVLCEYGEVYVSGRVDSSQLGLQKQLLDQPTLTARLFPSNTRERFSP